MQSHDPRKQEYPVRSSNMLKHCTCWTLGVMSFPLLVSVWIHPAVTHTHTQQWQLKSLSSTCGAKGVPPLFCCSSSSLCSHRGGDWATAQRCLQGWRSLSTQEGKMAFSAFVGIVALLTTLQTQGGQKSDDINGSLFKAKESWKLCLYILGRNNHYYRVASALSHIPTISSRFILSTMIHTLYIKTSKCVVHVWCH